MKTLTSDLAGKTDGLLTISGVNIDLSEISPLLSGTLSSDGQATQTVTLEVYDDIDTYVGQSINFTGYVYKTKDFNDTQFVLARDMLINSDSQSVVVGFLCNYDNTQNLKEGTWVNVTGQIIKGYYHDEIPIIHINKLKETNKPEEASQMGRFFSLYFFKPPRSASVPLDRHSTEPNRHAALQNEKAAVVIREAEAGVWG